MFDIETHIPQSLYKVPLRVKEDYSHFINLSSNEQPKSVAQRLIDNFIKQVSSKAQPLSHYTFIEDTRLRFATYLNCAVDNLCLSPGSDPAIYYILSLLRPKHDELIIQSPNYFNYDRYATILDYKQKHIPHINIDNELFMGSLEELNQHTQNGLFVIATPNGMTGEALSLHPVLNIIKEGQKRGNLFIVDLAYAAFNKQCGSWYQDIPDNLILIQSYSKSHGVAGLRIATLHLPGMLCQQFKKLGLENALNTLQLQFFDFIKENHAEFAKNIDFIQTEREHLKETLRINCPNWTVYDSQANFIAIDVNEPIKAQTIEQVFLNKNIKIKSICEPERYSISRISIGSEADNVNTLSLLEHCYAN